MHSETSGPRHRGIDELRPTGGSDHEDVSFRENIIQRRQQSRHDSLVGSLAAFAGSDGSQRIDVVEQYQRRALLLAVPSLWAVGFPGVVVVPLHGGSFVELAEDYRMGGFSSGAWRCCFMCLRISLTSCGAESV